jgi:hypothetical protein
MDPIFTPAVAAGAAAGIAPASAGMLAGAVGTEAALASGLAVPAATSGLSLGTVLSGAGFGLSALSSIASGNQANANARYQAELYQRQADRERQLAALDETEYRRRGSALLASQRARLGDAGVDFTGTALDLSDATAAELELQALKIRSGGLAKADDLDSQAALTRYGGVAAQRRGYLNALDSTVNGLDGLLVPRRSSLSDTRGGFG